MNDLNLKLKEGDLEGDLPFVHEECGDTMWDAVLEQEEQKVKDRRNLYFRYWEKGISYAGYLANMKSEAAEGKTEGYAAHVPLNLRRMERIDKTIRLSEEMNSAILGLSNKKYWLVLTEHWCGDAAQILPALHAIAQASKGKIELKMIYRDQNLELMDQFLTGTSRSIPKVLQLNERFELTGSWGPRPAAAQAMVLEMKKNNPGSTDYQHAVHKWYADDKQAAIQKELLTAFFQAV